jgi:hypothetical protein
METKASPPMETKEDFMHAFEKTHEKGDLKLTEEEAEKFKTAFDDPEFCKLMVRLMSFIITIVQKKLLLNTHYLCC